MHLKTLTSEQFIVALNALRGFVIEFNEILKTKYNLQDNPIHHTGRSGVVPKKDRFEIDGKVISYHYHGAGCSVDYNGIFLEFDVMTNDATITFSVWKLQQFLLSFFELDERSLSADEIYKFLVALEKKGIVSSGKFSEVLFEMELESEKRNSNQ